MSKSTANKAATSAASSPRRSSDAGWGLLELRPMRMSLEDIFLSLTTEDAADRGADEVMPPHTPEAEEEVADA